MKKIKTFALALAALLTIQSAFGQTQEQQDLRAEENLKKGMEFLAKNKTKEGVVELPNGLQYRIIRQGTGIKPAATDTVTVHYTGTLIDGTIFDCSRRRDRTSSFALNRVIRGWTEGFQHLNEGTKAVLYIPSDLAYGSRQRGEVISPNSVLIFEVELFKVSKFVPKEEE